MDKLQKQQYYNYLYSFYQNLLTEKQQEIFEDYNYNDYSLSEIAENHEISRNAVHDTLKKVEKALDQYEEKLSLYSKSKSIEKLLNELEMHADQEGKAIIKKIKEME